MVLIWCNVGSCSRVSGVMGVAMVVYLMRASAWCDGGRCVCVLRASGVMGVGSVCVLRASGVMG